MAFWVLILAGTCAEADEVHSNGRGGGSWSDPATWRGKAAPASEDEVVIARGDVVVFDRNDDKVAFVATGVAMVAGLAQPGAVGGLTVGADLLAGTRGKITCSKLSIDPKGGLAFKTGAGKIVLCVAGPIETYGTIKLDARASANDYVELRLCGTSAEKRTLQLKKGGSLLVHGRANLPGGRHNVALVARPQPLLKQPQSDPETLGVVEGEGGTMIDIQHAELVNIFLKGTSIDNTGAKPNERVNVARSRFTERSRILFVGCDTPTITANTFEESAPGMSATNAIHTYACSLAEIKGNAIRSGYSYGIAGTAMTDSVVTGNTVEKCTGGIYWYGENGMLKQNTIRHCSIGVAVTSMSGAMEDIVIDGCATGIYHAGATAQATNCRVLNIPKDGMAVSHFSGPLTLLNCNIRPEQIKLTKEVPPPATRPEFLVQSMDFLVVASKGGVPLGSRVEVTTANPPRPLPPGAADLNVRNVPAPFLRNGLTPLPKTTEAIVVKSWSFDADGKLVAAPEYTVQIVHGGKVVSSVKVKPDAKWYREKPDEAIPTVEVPAK
jgi:hypothetical protein